MPEQELLLAKVMRSPVPFRFYSCADRNWRVGSLIWLKRSMSMSSLLDFRSHPMGKRLHNPTRSEVLLEDLQYAQLKGVDFHLSKPHSHRGFSVRRASLPRGSSSEYSLPTVQFSKSENETSSVTISQEVVQSDPEIRLNCIRDANASGSCYKKSVIQPKTSLQVFEPSTPIQNINLPAINEEESPSKEILESSGSGSEWDGCRSIGEVGSKIVTVDVAERGFRSSSMRRYLHNSRKLMAMGTGSKRNEIEARTIAWQEAKTAKVLNRLKRQESLIVAWESEQKAKADIHMTRVERKLEEKRAKELERTHNKLARVHKKVEQRKAVERKKINAETARVTAIVDKTQSTGKLPRKCIFF